MYYNKWHHSFLLHFYRRLLDILLPLHPLQNKHFREAIYVAKNYFLEQIFLIVCSAFL